MKTSGPKHLAGDPEPALALAGALGGARRSDAGAMVIAATDTSAARLAGCGVAPWARYRARATLGRHRPKSKTINIRCQLGTERGS